MLRKKIGRSVNKWILNLFAVLFVAQSFAAEKTFVVTNTKDSGEGSLRAAIEASNENSEGPNQIVFKLEAGSGSEIEISKPLVINSKTTLNGKIGNKNITIVGNEEINGISIYDITDVTVKNVTVKGCNYGVYAVRALDVKVDSSEFVENITGFYCASGRFEVSNSLASGNYRGISMTQPMFAGGTTIGMNVHDLTVRNCVIGLNKACLAAYPNETGIFISGSSLFPKIYDCVIAGNTGNGIDLYAHSARIAKNYIGMNRNFKDFGNGANGAELKENGGTVLLGSFTDRDSCNYIGFNKEYGVAGQSGDVYNNYIGLAYNKERDEYTATPNGMGGINLSYGFFVDNVIGFNKGNGIEGGARIENNVIGGDGIHTFANEGYGVVVKSGAMTGNKIFSNKLGGVDRPTAYYSGNDDVINVSKNYFGGNQPFAYSDVPNCYKPVITSLKDNGSTVTVTGTVKFSDATFSMPSYLDDEKVGIELYISEGKESAVEYVGYVESDKDGNWTYEVKKSEFNTKKYFTATAIHYEYSQGQYLKNYNFTSALAEPKSLIPEAKSYYVKVNAEGSGDGSTWDNAMSAEDFAFWIQKVEDGTTFYVAEGKYRPYYTDVKGSFQYTINSSIKISGGYPKDSKGTEKNYDPVKYQTIFTGDPSGDDHYEFQTRGYKTVDPSDDDIDIRYLFILDNDDATVGIEGCVMKACTYYNSEYYPSYVANVFSGRESGDVGHLNLKDCVFDVIGGFHVKEFNAESCVFHNQPTTASPSSVLCAEKAEFSKCSLKGMIGLSGGNFARVKSITVANCLIDSLLSSSVIFDVNEQHIYNNTFVNLIADGTSQYLFPAVSNRHSVVEVVGNMFVNCKYQNLVEGEDNAMVKYNLCEGGLKGTALDIETNDDPNTLLDGVLNTETGRFDINYNNGKGVVKGSMLLTTTLADGTSVRFPLENTKVVDDQYNVERLDETCMGAYEIIGCDTLVVTNGLCYGAGSFRSVLEKANMMSGSVPVVIIFDFEGKGTKTICLDTTVTMNRGNLTIDGSTYPDSIVIKAADNSFEGLRFVSCANNITLKGLAFEGFFEAVHFLGIRNVSIDSCTFDSNYIGIYNQSSDVTVEKSIFTNNDKGFYSSYMWIVGCDYTYRSIIKNNIFGLSADQKSAKPNKIGIHIGGTSSGSSGEHELRIHNNVISGNSENGIFAAGAFANNSYGLITKNLIGTNKYGDDFGNGANGIFTEIPAGSLYIGTNNVDSANVIVFNHENGVAAEKRNSLNVRANFIGMSSDFKPMPNQGSGIYSDVYANVSDCYIGFNKKDGIEGSGSVTLTNSFIGGDGKKEFGNEGYGINNTSSVKMTSNYIYNNKLGGVYKEQVNTSYPGASIVASKNLFGGKNQPFAISDVSSEDIHAPKINKVEAFGENSIKITGNVEKLAKDLPISMPKYVDETSITVELFSNEGTPETAYKFEAVVESDEDGNFEFILNDASKYANSCFTATATFRFVDDYGIGTGYYTSVLATPACITQSSVDEISSVESVIYPNPASDRVMLVNASDAQYMIYNALGQKVMGGVSNGSEINVSSLPAGIYRLDVANVGQETLIIRK